MSNIVTAAILVIGDEILSGRTKDKNIGYIAEYLTMLGIDLKEVRVVADDEDEIVAAINALRHKFNYLFTTGGIGPTHDDITADCVAKAFGVGISHHEGAIAMLRDRFTNPADLNEARLRMARIPHGGELIANAVSKAPGFKIGNVFVMAGVPMIMQAMLEVIAPTLNVGVKLLSRTVEAEVKEGDIATSFGAIAKEYPSLMLGSYPYMTEKGFFTRLVVRGRDQTMLDEAVEKVAAMAKSYSAKGEVIVREGK
jgi:molybdenum cofactor synthesis domain-containing protein